MDMYVYKSTYLCMHIYVCVYIRKSFICLPLYLCSPVVPQCKQLKRTSKQTLQKALHTCHVIRAYTAFGSVCFYGQKSPKNKHSNTLYIPATSAILSSTSSMRAMTLCKEKPTYTPKSPTYTTKSPAYIPKIPTYTPKSPTHAPKSPTYTQKRPTYTYTPKSPTIRRAPHTEKSPKNTHSQKLHPPAPINHVKIFKGWPPRDAPSKLVQLWYKTFSPDQRSLAEMQNPTRLSNKSSTA